MPSAPTARLPGAEVESGPEQVSPWGPLRTGFLLSNRASWPRASQG